MSTASNTHAHDTQEPTPLHPVAEPVHVTFADATDAAPEAAWCEDMTEQPDPPCTHDWRTENVSRDPEMRVVRAWCAKCGAKKMLALDDAHEWRSLNLTPPEDALIDARFPTRGSIPSPNATVPAPPPMPAPLTATERSAFLGLQAQAREYERAVNEQERAIVAEIEARLGLDAGSIGTTFTVNPQTWTVAAMPQPDAQIAAIAQQHAEALRQRGTEPATVPEA